MKNGSIIQVADGFADGTKSLVKNTLMAPIGAVSKFGNSLSRGIMALSFDEEYMEEKNTKDRLNKPKDIGDGFIKGVSNAGQNIWSGVTGIFTKPVEGMQREGIGGLITGIGKGAAGFVTKSVSGAVDIVAKSSEGLENYANYSETTELGFVKIRESRIFYENVNLIQTYRVLDASWVSKLMDLYPHLDLRNIYLVHCIPEQFTRKVTNNVAMYCLRANLIIVTKLQIIHILITHMHPKEDLSKHLKHLEERYKR
jgi:vacuolar protein sorting-associated protein 13A/C